MTAALAIYDMDRTVTRGPTYGPFVWYASTRLAPWRLLLAPLAGLATLAYGIGAIDRGRLKELTYRLLVGRADPKRLDRVIQAFADRQLATNILPGARARLAEDKAAGRRLVLATASYRLYAAAIAERLGFDDVIATDTEMDAEGRTVARIDGRNCYGIAKLDMIEAGCSARATGGRSIRFYSDRIRCASPSGPTSFRHNARPPRPPAEKGWQVLTGGSPPP